MKTLFGLLVLAFASELCLQAQPVTDFSQPLQQHVRQAQQKRMENSQTALRSKIMGIAGRSDATLRTEAFLTRLDRFFLPDTKRQNTIHLIRGYDFLKDNGFLGAQLRYYGTEHNAETGENNALYPSQRSGESAEMAQALAQLVSAWPTERTLILLQSLQRNPNVYELPFIYSVFGAAVIASPANAGKLRTVTAEELAALRRNSVNDLKTIYNYKYRLAPVSLEDDQQLRNQAAKLLWALGEKRADFPLLTEPKRWISFWEKKDEITAKASTGLLILSVVYPALARGGKMVTPAAVRSAPVVPGGAVRAPIMKINATPRVSGSAPIRPTARAPHANTISARYAGAYEGSAALKMQPQNSPLRVTQTQPLQVAKTAVAPVPPSVATPHKTTIITQEDKAPYVGNPLTQEQSLNREQLLQKIQRGQATLDDILDAKGLSAGERYDLLTNSALQAKIAPDQRVSPPSKEWLPVNAWKGFSSIANFLKRGFGLKKMDVEAEAEAQAEGEPEEVSQVTPAVEPPEENTEIIAPQLVQPEAVITETPISVLPKAVFPTMPVIKLLEVKPQVTVPPASQSEAVVPVLPKVVFPIIPVMKLLEVKTEVAVPQAAQPEEKTEVMAETQKIILESIPPQRGALAARQELLQRYEQLLTAPDNLRDFHLKKMFREIEDVRWRLESLRTKIAQQPTGSVLNKTVHLRQELEQLTQEETWLKLGIKDIFRQKDLVKYKNFPQFWAQEYQPLLLAGGRYLAQLDAREEAYLHQQELIASQEIEPQLRQGAQWDAYKQAIVEYSNNYRQFKAGELPRSQITANREKLAAMRKALKPAKVAPKTTFQVNLATATQEELLEIIRANHGGLPDAFESVTLKHAADLQKRIATADTEEELQALTKELTEWIHNAYGFSDQSKGQSPLKRVCSKRVCSPLTPEAYQAEAHMIYHIRNEEDEVERTMWIEEVNRSSDYIHTEPY